MPIKGVRLLRKRRSFFYVFADILASVICLSIQLPYQLAWKIVGRILSNVWKTLPTHSVLGFVFVMRLKLSLQEIRTVIR